MFHRCLSLCVLKAISFGIVLNIGFHAGHCQAPALAEWGPFVGLVATVRFQPPPPVSGEAVRSGVALQCAPKALPYRQRRADFQATPTQTRACYGALALVAGRPSRQTPSRNPAVPAAGQPAAQASNWSAGEAMPALTAFLRHSIRRFPGWHATNRSSMQVRGYHPWPNSCVACIAPATRTGSSHPQEHLPTTRPTPLRFEPNPFQRRFPGLATRRKLLSVKPG